MYYAVTNGYKTGIFNTWNECNKQVKGYKNAKFKKFKTKQEAEEFINLPNKINNNIQTISLSDNSNIKNTKQSTLFGFVDDNNTKPFEPDYYVYTDGACSNNGYKNAIAGLGIFFDSSDIRVPNPPAKITTFIF